MLDCIESFDSSSESCLQFVRWRGLVKLLIAVVPSCEDGLEDDFGISLSILVVGIVCSAGEL